jgi:CRISPR-associated protein Csx10
VRHGHDSQAVHYHKRDVDQRLLTRVAINRRRMVAEDGLLYSPYVISQAVERDRHDKDKTSEYVQACFVSHVWRLPDTFDKGLLKRIQTVGGSTSRGLGHVSIEIETPEGDVGDPEAVQRRVEALDADIKATMAQFRKWTGKAESGEDVCEGTYFVVGLWSDAVLRTVQGLPTMVFDAEMLEAATGIKAALVRSYASYGYGGGWQSAWGLPKPAEVLARSGAVYLFCAEELADADYRSLANLEITGVGEQTAEGYGQVRISDEFHLKRRGPNE